MTPFDVCVTIVTAILGLAYPVIITIVSNDKYSSEAITSLFDTHWSKKCFSVFIVISITLIFYYFIAPTRQIDTNIDLLNKLIDNSAELLLVLSTVLLIVTLLSMINYVITIYRTPNLIKHLASKEQSIYSKNDFTSLDGMVDIYIWSQTNSPNSSVQKDLSTYFYSIFKHYRDAADNSNLKAGITYPSKLYELIYTVLKNNLERNAAMPYPGFRTIIGSWLIGSTSYRISKTTYQWYWEYLTLAIEKERLDYVLDAWKWGFNHMHQELAPINREHKFTDGEFSILNQEEIDERDEQRKEFFEFHIALGGLLLYKKQYEVLRDAFNYTQSIPPSYPLLPSYMNEIFELYFKFSNPYENENYFINSKYRFRNFDGIDSDRKILYWMCQYICLLYIRQFHLQTYYIYQDPTALPQIPKSISSQKYWLQNIGSFKANLIELLKDDSLLKILGYKNRSAYRSFINDLREKLNTTLKLTVTTSELESNKTESFIKKSKSLTYQLFKNIDRINNETNNDAVEFKFEKSIAGLYDIVDKEEFLDSGITHLNFDTRLGYSVVRKVTDSIAHCFIANSTKVFVLNEANVFNALRKMNLTSEHLLISFGIEEYLQYKSMYNILELSNDHFGETEIIKFPFSNFLEKAIFVIHKSDLPIINFVPKTEQEIEFYHLKPLHKEFNIYYSLFDLAKNPTLEEKLKTEKTNAYMGNLYEAITFLIKVKWHSNRKLIQIVFTNNLNSQLKENSLEEIEPII